MSAIGSNAFRLPVLALACFLVTCIVGGCPEKEPETPREPDPGETPAPVLIESLGTVLTPGGKAPAGRYWVWNPKAGDRGEWEEKRLVISGVTPRNDGLAGGAKAAATSTGGGAPNGQTVFLPNAALFAGGIGVRPDFYNATPQAYFYDFAADEWTGLEMGSARSGHTLTTLLDGRILIVGGWDGTRVPNARGGQNQPSLSSTELFDPSDRTFRPGGALLTARSGHAAARLADGRVLIVGGGSGNFETDDSLVRGVEIYDPATDSFAARGGMLVALSVPVATTLDDGRVLVFGDNALTSAEVFDPMTGTFSALGNMTAIHGYGATATKLKDGRVLILGGAGDGRGVDPTAAAELFDPATDKFTAVVSMSHPRKTHVAVLQDDGTVLVVGGITAIQNGPNVSFEPIAACELFDLATNTFSALPDSPTTSADGAGVFLRR